MSEKKKTGWKIPSSAPRLLAVFFMCLLFIFLLTLCSENTDVTDTPHPGASDSPGTSGAPSTSDSTGISDSPGVSDEPKVTYTPSDWMGAIDDDKPISELSIPGTHDNCALYEPLGGTAACQSMTIPEQLASGVRYLDIRCRRVDNSFEIYHGIVSQRLSFSELLSQIYAFLDENPTEAVIMCVKEEHTPSGENDSFETILKRYIDEDPDRFFTESGIPAIGSVRGKIVLMRRFDGSIGYPAFHGWADNAEFTINNGSTSLHVQDYYNISDKALKWQMICDFFEKASPSPSSYYLNNTSGYTEGLFSIPDITDVSEYINPLLAEYLKEENVGFLGITATDFMTEEMAELIVRENFS